MWAGLRLQLDALNLEEQQAQVRLKGGRVLWLPFGNRSAAALERYLRFRRMHRDAELPYMRLGLRGRFAESGIGQMLSERAKQAKLAVRVHPHMFRHTFSHLWKESGGSDDDLMELAGWTNERQLARYGRKRRAERARNAHRRLSPGDRL